MSTMHKTSIDIDLKTRKAVIDILNTSLATTTDLYSAIKQAHWNVKGIEFIAIHKFFDELAEEILEQVDVIAERVTALGGTAQGTLQQAVKGTLLKPYPTNIFTVKEHLKALAERYASTAAHAREAIEKTDALDDMATNDLYIDLARLVDKQLWFIEAHLQA